MQQQHPRRSWNAEGGTPRLRRIQDVATVPQDDPGQGDTAPQGAGTSGAASVRARMLRRHPRGAGTQGWCPRMKRDAEGGASG